MYCQSLHQGLAGKAMNTGAARHDGGDGPFGPRNAMDDRVGDVDDLLINGSRVVAGGIWHRLVVADALGLPGRVRMRVAADDAGEEVVVERIVEAGP